MRYSQAKRSTCPYLGKLFIRSANDTLWFLQTNVSTKRYLKNQDWLNWTQTGWTHWVFSKKSTILPTFGIFQFSNTFVRKTDKNKINAYATYFYFLVLQIRNFTWKMFFKKIQMIYKYERYDNDYKYESYTIN